MLLFAKIVALVGLFLGSLEDMRTREVPDWLSFSLIFIGVGSALIFSIFRNDYSILLSSVVGLAVCVGLAYLMFYTAQWGGGDSKLLMGMGALIGLDVLNLNTVPLLLVFLINVMLFGAIYGLLYSFYMAGRNWKDFKKDFKKKLEEPKVVLLRKLNIGVALLLLVLIVFVSLQLKILLFTIMLVLYATLYMWLLVKSVEDCCMVKDVDIDVLTEGDWVVEEVNIEGERICGPGDLGLKKEQIKKLKKLKKKLKKL